MKDCFPSTITALSKYELKFNLYTKLESQSEIVRVSDAVLVSMTEVASRSSLVVKI